MTKKILSLLITLIMAISALLAPMANSVTHSSATVEAAAQSDVYLPTNDIPQVRIDKEAQRPIRHNKRAARARKQRRHKRNRKPTRRAIKAWHKACLRLKKAAEEAKKAEEAQKAEEAKKAEEARKHRPMANEADPKAPFRWPQEVTTYTQRNSFTKKLLRKAFLLPLTPLMAINFGARKVTLPEEAAKKVPTMEELAELAEKASKEHEAEQRQFKSSEEKIAAIKADKYSKYLTAKNNNKAAKAATKAAIAANNDSKAEINAATKENAEILEKLEKAEDRLHAAKAALSSVPNAPKGPNAWAHSMASRSNDLLGRLRCLEGIYLRKGNTKAAQEIHEKCKKAEKLARKYNEPIEKAEEYVVDCSEDALVAFNEYEDAAKDVAYLTAAYDKSCARIDAAYEQFSKTDAAERAAYANEKVTKRELNSAEISLYQLPDDVKDELEKNRERVIASSDARELAVGNYNRAQHAKFLEDKVEQEEAVTNTAEMPAARHGEERHAQAVVHKRRTARNIYVSAQTQDGRKVTIYARKGEDIPSLCRKCVELATRNATNTCMVDICRDGQHNVSVRQLVDGQWAKRDKLLNKKHEAIDAKAVFASGVTKENEKFASVPMGDDYHGNGALPEYQLVLLDPQERVCYSETFGSEYAATRAFEEVSACCVDGWQYQLFKHGTVVRRTGDNQEYIKVTGPVHRKLAIDAMLKEGITEARAIKIADHFCIEDRNGEGTLHDIIEDGNIDALTEIKGIGKATAQKAIAALKGKLQANDEPVKPESRYTDVEKIVYDGNVNESKIVHMKSGQLEKYLRKVSLKKGVNPDEHPVFVFFQQKIDRKLDENQQTSARMIIRDIVQNGIVRGGMKYLHTLHGTNAAKECKVCCIRQDLISEAIGFCTADANPKAKFTVAKLMAYMGLKLVGTDDMPFEFKGEWVYIGRDFIKLIEDNVVFVKNDDVSKVAKRLVTQNAFDGAGILHFSDKVKKEILAGCKTEAERAKVSKFLDELDAHTGRVLPFMKSMNVVCFDIHKFYHDRGIHELGGRNIDDIVFFGTKSCFKGSIGPDGTHATWGDFFKACAKYHYHAGMVLHAHDLKDADLSSQQIQTLAGISRRTIEQLVGRSIKNVRRMFMEGEGLQRITGNRKLADIINAVPQLAAEQLTAQRLQEGFENIYKIGTFGKLFNQATSAFVAPDPIALATWLAYEDESKIEYSIKPWEIVTDDERFYDGQKIVISRNPCTDLSGLVVVTVRKSFGKQYDRYFKSPYHVVFVSVLDTAATRLRMDFDGDHMVLIDNPDFVKAVEEATKVWYPGFDRHPVIDWDPVEAEKKSITEDDKLLYFANLVNGDELGRYMDILTKLYNWIEDASFVTDDVRKAVAWLTYAVNVLVDASKHGGASIKMPDFVAKFVSLKLSRSVAESKMEEGKEVDANSVMWNYGKGILDTIASIWMETVPRTFKFSRCDYNIGFNPLTLLSERKVQSFNGEKLKDVIKLEDNARMIHNLVGKDGWHFYPYIDDAMTMIPPAEGYIRFEKRFESMADLDKAWEKAKQDAIKEGKEVNMHLMPEYVAVVLEESTVILERGWDKAKKAPTWTEIPGKWIHYEAAQTSKDTVAYTPFFQILQSRREEAEFAFKVDGDANDRRKAATDKANLRKYLAWSTKQSVRAYASLYGADLDAALDKLIIWAWKPREVGNWKPNKFVIDLFIDAFADMIIERADRNDPAFNVVAVRFNPAGKAYTYLTKESIAVGEQVVVETENGEKPILTVAATGVRRKSELERHLPFAQYKYAEAYAG